MYRYYGTVPVQSYTVVPTGEPPCQTAAWRVWPAAAAAATGPRSAAAAKLLFRRRVRRVPAFVVCPTRRSSCPARSACALPAGFSLVFASAPCDFSCFSPFCEGLESILGNERKPCPISLRLRFATFATLRKDLHRPRRRSAQTAQRVDCSTVLVIRMRAKPCDRS